MSLGLALAQVAPYYNLGLVVIALFLFLNLELSIAVITCWNNYDNSL